MRIAIDFKLTSRILIHSLANHYHYQWNWSMTSNHIFLICLICFLLIFIDQNVTNFVHSGSAGIQYLVVSVIESYSVINEARRLMMT